MSEQTLGIVLLTGLALFSFLLIFFNNAPVLFERLAWWVAILASAYFSNNFWIFAGVVGLICFLCTDKTAIDKLSCYFLLLPIIPAYFAVEIPGGIPGVRMWFPLSYPRMLNLFILLPLFINLIRHANSIRDLVKLPTDIYVLLFVGIQFFFTYHGDSFTDRLRFGFCLFLDIFLPYYVISRSMVTIADFKKALSSILFTAIVLSIFGLAEVVSQHSFYMDIAERFQSYGAVWGKFIGQLLYRYDIVRIMASFGQPLAFGFFLVLAFGAWDYLRDPGGNRKTKDVVVSILMALTLLLTFSRGSWLGCSVFFCSMIFFQRRTASILLAAFFTLAISFNTIRMIPLHERESSLAPSQATHEGSSKTLAGQVPNARPQAYPQTVDHALETVQYRKAIIKPSIEQIAQSPWFGSSVDAVYAGPLKGVKQRRGLIDITNTYLGIALNRGLVVLGLFLMIFFDLICRIFMVARSRRTEKDSDSQHLGQVLLSILLAIVVMLSTTSSISSIPIYYWSFIALSVAFVMMTRRTAV